MKKLNREQKLNKARKFLINSYGSRPLIAKEINVGRSWIERFVHGKIKDPSYLRVCKILDYMSKYGY